MQRTAAPLAAAVIAMHKGGGMPDTSFNAIMDIVAGKGLDEASGRSGRNRLASRDAFSIVLKRSQTALQSGGGKPGGTVPEPQSGVEKESQRAENIRQENAAVSARRPENTESLQADGEQQRAARDEDDGGQEAGQATGQPPSGQDSARLALLEESDDRQAAAELPDLGLPLPVLEDGQGKELEELLEGGAITVTDEDDRPLARHSLQAFAVSNDERAALAAAALGAGMAEDFPRATDGGVAAPLSSQSAAALSPKLILETLLRQRISEASQEIPAQQRQAMSEDIQAVNEQSDNELLELFENLENSKLKQLLETAAGQSKAIVERRISAEAIIDQLTGRSGENDIVERLSPTAPLAQPGSRAPAPGVQQAVTTINLPLEDKAWGDELARRISFLMRGQVQQAEIRLNPPELGPINIRLNLVQDQASISFAAQHHVVREAIEASLPRLRELLSESGMQLANADVGSHLRDQHAHREDPGSGDGRLSPALLPGDDDGMATELKPGLRIGGDHLVDFFA